MATSTKRTFTAEDEIVFGAYADADLRTYRFEGAIVTRGNFRRTDLRGVQLHVLAYRADFHSSSLEGAKLDDANFFACNFRNANLRSASLQRTKLGHCDLTDVDLAGADLSDADLRSAIGLTPEQLLGAHHWRRAKLLPALRSETEAYDLTIRRAHNEHQLGHQVAHLVADTEIVIDLTGTDPSATSAEDWPQLFTRPPAVSPARPNARPPVPTSAALIRRAAHAYGSSAGTTSREF